MKEDLKNVLLMGLGALSMTNDKAQELKQELLEKGTKFYEEGKVKNEELKHTLKEKVKDSVTVVVEKEDMSKEELFDKVNNMSAEEKAELLNLLKEKKTKKDEQ